MLSDEEAQRLLNDQQLLNLGRIKLGILKIKEAIDRANALIAETGLDIRRIPDYHLGMSLNDIGQLAFLHGLAEDKIKKAAQEATERLAA